MKLLIKLKNKELDIKRKNLSNSENYMHELNTELTKLDQELHKEQESIKNFPELSYMYEKYYFSNRKKKQDINLKIHDIQHIIDKLKELIYIDFADVKKYEISLDDKIRSLNKKIKDKEQNNLDEISLNKYIKHNKDN